MKNKKLVKMFKQLLADIEDKNESLLFTKVTLAKSTALSLADNKEMEQLRKEKAKLDADVFDLTRQLVSMRDFMQDNGTPGTKTTHWDFWLRNYWPVQWSLFK